jgi:hypothetical protein
MTSFPRSPTCRPQCFSHSRRVAPPGASWACFIPQPRPGFALQGFFPAAKLLDLVGRPSPPAVGAVSLPVSCLSGASWRRLDSRGSIRAAIRCHAARGLAPPMPDPLLRFQLPRASFRPPWERLHVPSAHDLHRRVLRVHSVAGLQRINQRPARRSVSTATFPSKLSGLLSHHRSGDPARPDSLPSSPLRPPNDRSLLQSTCQPARARKYAETTPCERGEVSSLRSQL